MNISRHPIAAFSFLLAVGIFLIGWHQRPPVSNVMPIDVYDRVVVPAPMQLLLAGGDPFLAANLESIRALAAQSDSPEAIGDNLSFSARARHAVSRLNPCHEDNFYLSNSLVTWGGAIQEGNKVLAAATHCRFWDEIPPFFYGFNLYYFEHDAVGASKAINDAAMRSRENAAVFRKLAIMFNVGTFQDDSLALSYLEGERDLAKDARLRDMLEKRIIRLNGLLKLKEAQADYEKNFRKPLTEPQDLIRAGLIREFPTDPLKIGYEFRDGRFHLREVNIGGLEPPHK